MQGKPCEEPRFQNTEHLPLEVPKGALWRRAIDPIQVEGFKGAFRLEVDCGYKGAGSLAQVYLFLHVCLVAKEELLELYREVGEREFQ